VFELMGLAVFDVYVSLWCVVTAADKSKFMWQQNQCVLATG